MLLIALLLFTSDPDPELSKIRKGKDQHSKSIRIGAYGFAACHFALLSQRYSYDANRLRTPDAFERARFFSDALKKATVLAKRDTDTGIPCDGQDYAAINACFAALRYPNLQDVPPCEDLDGKLAAKLALIDLPELAR